MCLSSPKVAPDDRTQSGDWVAARSSRAESGGTPRIAGASPGPISSHVRAFGPMR
jgi:hypothetical protein